MSLHGLWRETETVQRGSVLRVFVIEPRARGIAAASSFRIAQATAVLKLAWNHVVQATFLTVSHSEKERRAMDSPRADRDDQTPEVVPSTPAELSGNAATRRGSTQAIQSYGLMPMLLGVAALVLLVLLVFGGDPAPNEPVEPRGQTKNAPK